MSWWTGTQYCWLTRSCELTEAKQGVAIWRKVTLLEQHEIGRLSTEQKACHFDPLGFLVCLPATGQSIPSRYVCGNSEKPHVNEVLGRCMTPLSRHVVDLR